MEVPEIQMNAIKFILTALTVSLSTVSADLIGYNRLGNRVNGHYLARNIKKDSYKKYMKQLDTFISENPSQLSEKIKNFVKLKVKKKNFTRRKFYSSMMRSLCLNTVFE